MNNYEKRLKRTLDAVKMKPVDKIPFSYSGVAYIAKRRHIPMKDFIGDYPRAIEAVTGFLKSLPDIDSIHNPIMFPRMMSKTWLSEVKLPGEELPDDEIWQVDEREVMVFGDYEIIAETGYGAWLEDVLKNRLGDPLSKAADFFRHSEIALRKVAEAGVPAVAGASFASPFESFCGGRTMMNFFIDLQLETDTVKKALDKAQEFLLSEFKETLRRKKPVAAWIGGWRAAPELLSPEMWREFAWLYLKPAILAAADAGTIPILHFDSCWDNALETLKELPPQTCILMLDGKTDMRKARAVLDDRICLMGDVPPYLSAFGSEEEVYDYVMKLIDDVGPKTGLIISTGCDCPPNAAHKNVDAMIRATRDYRVAG